MNKYKLLLCGMVLILTFLVVACESVNEMPTPSQVQLPASTKIISSSGTPAKKVTSVPTPTISSELQCHTLICMGSVPAPTLVPAVQEKFFELLQSNGKCELPCFLGITPGKTNIQAAKTILEPFISNSPILGDETRSTQSGRTYSTQIRTKANKDISIEMVMSLAMDVDVNDVVQRIIIRIELYGDGFTELNDKHLSRYGLREIFLKNGSPSVIYFSPERGGYGFNVVYDELKMAIVFAGNAKKNSGSGTTVCPNIGDGDVSSMMMVLASPSDPTDVKKMIGYPIEGNPTLESATGISLNNFYHLMIGDQKPACFQMK